MSVDFEDKVDTDEKIADGKAPTNHLLLLQQAIAKLPTVDPQKVQAALQKLQNGGFEILGSEEERLASAQRIAQKIIDESAE